MRVTSAAISSLVVVFLALLGMARADEWPMVQHDPGRSGITAEDLRFPLAPVWRYMPANPPLPAWSQPGKELHRMDFDYAFQPVAAGGLVYFASSSDDTVRAVDAATGKRVWRFAADGPIRFAPSISGGRAFVGSDDGHIYGFSCGK